MRRRKKNHIVICSGCANLFYPKGGEPLCVATAEFRSGPLRDRIDVVGVTSALVRNAKNDCKHRECVSVMAYRLKKWLLWRVNDGRIEKIRTGRIEDYPIDAESESGTHQRRGDKPEVNPEEEDYDSETLTDEEIDELIGETEGGLGKEETQSESETPEAENSEG